VRANGVRVFNVGATFDDLAIAHRQILDSPDWLT
jgi:hypothetical protein